MRIGFPCLRIIQIVAGLSHGAGAHHVTATNGLESLCSCLLSDVEGSRLTGSFRRFHLRIWPGDQGWDHLS